jgi:hypothetical protein
MDGDKPGCEHAGTFVPYRCDRPWIDNDKTERRMEIPGCTRSWQRLPALLPRDVANRTHNSPAHDDLFHPVLIGNLVEECNMAVRDERGSKMAGKDAVDQGDIRGKRRPDVPRGSHRDFAGRGTACTRTGQDRNMAGIAPVKEHFSQERRVHLRTSELFWSKNIVYRAIFWHENAFLVFITSNLIPEGINEHSD